MTEVEKIARGLSANAKKAMVRGKHSIELANARLTNWSTYTPLGLAVRKFLQEQSQ